MPCQLPMQLLCKQVQACVATYIRFLCFRFRSNRKVSSIPCVYVCKSEQQLARDIFFKRKTYTCVAVNRKFSECLSVNTNTTQYSVPFQEYCKNKGLYTFVVVSTKSRKYFFKKNPASIFFCKKNPPSACMQVNSTASRPGHLGGPFRHNNSPVQES